VLGGGGGCINCVGTCDCGGGGGRSAIQLNGQDIVTAGGGGGAGNYNGGAATSYSSNLIQTVSYQAGGTNSMTTACTYVFSLVDGNITSGGGGSKTRGGCGYYNGSQYQGGSGSGKGTGGGGGGYYGINIL
jgi:collagen type III alpha